jgi:hypothetical protein
MMRFGAGYAVAIPAAEDHSSLADMLYCDLFYNKRDIFWDPVNALAIFTRTV